MSYHILHQFDEQWFADNGREQEASRGRIFGGSEATSPSARQRSCQRRQWLVVAAALLVASCALYFALDARRQADTLQLRLIEMETRLKK